MGRAGLGAEVRMAPLRPGNGKMKRDGKMMNARSTDWNLSITWSDCEAFARNPRTGGGGVLHLWKTQPMRSKEASTRLAFVDGHALTRHQIAGEGWGSPHRFQAGPQEPARPEPPLWRSRAFGSLHRPLRLITLESRPSTAHRFPARSRCATSGSPPNPPPARTGGL